MLTVVCPRCATKHFADEQHAGRHLRCSKCEDILTIRNTASTKAGPQLIRPSVPFSLLKVGRAWRNLRVTRVKKGWLGALLLVSVVGGLLAWKLSAVSRKPPAKPSHGKQASANLLNPTDRSLQHRDDLDVPVYLPNGTLLGPARFAQGHGELTIRNGTNDDAVVILMSAETKRVARKVYITANSDFTLLRITEGAYQLYFDLGQGWNPLHRRFRSPGKPSEFGKTLIFSERETLTAIEYSRHLVTLQPVIGGDVPVETIGTSSFQSLMDSE